MDWFLYDNCPRHERLKIPLQFIAQHFQQPTLIYEPTLLHNLYHHDYHSYYQSKGATGYVLEKKVFLHLY